MRWFSWYSSDAPRPMLRTSPIDLPYPPQGCPAPETRPGRLPPPRPPTSATTTSTGVSSFPSFEFYDQVPAQCESGYVWITWAVHLVHFIHRSVVEGGGREGGGWRRRRRWGQVTWFPFRKCSTRLSNNNPLLSLPPTPSPSLTPS